jgi:hypothetical protein
MRKLTPEELNKKILEIHLGLVTMDVSTYINGRTLARFIDRDYGDWWTIPQNVLHSKSGHPLRKKETIKNKLSYSEIELKEKIFSVWGDIVSIDFSTFKSTNRAAKFIDADFGEWWTHPSNVIYNGHGHPKRGRSDSKNTCMDRYGVENPTQNREIALKAAKKGKTSHIREHWKTGKELTCTASYELKVVDYLNAGKIDFEWQPKMFDMPNGKRYLPDLFLIEENKWVEIKGWMRPIAKTKWDWFQSEYPNSELWDKKKLKEMGIL